MDSFSILSMKKNKIPDIKNYTNELFTILFQLCSAFEDMKASFNIYLNLFHIYKKKAFYLGFKEEISI